MRRLIISILFFSFISMMVACGPTNSDNNENAIKNAEPNNSEPQEPVTVTMSTAHIDEEWLGEMKDKVEDKFKHITLELVEMPEIDTEEFEDEVFRGNIPDILAVLEQRRDFTIAREYGLEYDFEDIIKKKDFDLSVFDESVITSLRNATPTLGIVALPFQSNYFAINYNKEVFDQFGVPYPSESMTWKEVMNLAKEMTREQNGTQYHGVTMNAYLAPFIFSQFEENLIDPETNEINIVNSETMKDIFSMLEEYASIPNNLPSGHWGTDFENGNVAMDINWARTYNVEDGIPGVNLDFAPFPTWESNPNVGPEPNIASWMITNTSEHKEAAFDVLSYLTSAEARISDIRKGSISALADPEIKEQYMADINNYEDYQLGLLQELTPSNGAPKISLYENSAPLRELMEKFVTEKRGTDVNEYLREVEQVMQNYITDQEEKE